MRDFPNGALLFDHCSKFGFEGVVSKRLASRYSSGPSRNWVKTKCSAWKRINAERHKLERLRAPGLTQGMARELKKQQALLEREIAELEATA